MSPLELKRKKLELMRVQTARNEIEFKIEECLEQIERLKEHVKIQIDAELKLNTELAAIAAAETQEL